MSALRSWQTLLTAATLLVGLTARAGPPGDKIDPRDVEIALHARMALSKEAELAKLHLGVIVRQGEATVWGVAPTWELAERALKTVEKVPGVLSVRNQVRLSGGSTEEAVQNLLGGLAQGGA